MNISLNWLNEYINLSNVDPENIKNKLTTHTVEVEKIIHQKDSFKNVVVAKILEIKNGRKSSRAILFGRPHWFSFS